VGWPHKNVVRELLREPDRVSLVLKKVPVPETPQQVPATLPTPSLLSDPGVVPSSISCFWLLLRPLLSPWTHHAQ